MAFVITIAQHKGGAGKTTLACQLAATLSGESGGGFRVATIDLDPQQSLSYWAGQRADVAAGGGPACRYGNIAAPGFRGISALSRLSHGVDVVIVDTAPHDLTMGQQAVRKADLVLIPMQLTPFDLLATKSTLEMVRKIGRPMMLVYNRVPPRSKIAEVIRQRLNEVGAPAARTELGSRTDFAHSVLTGRGVTELAPASRAAAEISALAGEVMQSAALPTAA